MKRLAPWFALLGPDGSGKSTVIGEVATALRDSSALTGVVKFHWRPRIIRRAPRTEEARAETTAIPYSKPPRGIIQSTLMLLLLLFDWWLGYCFRIVPLRRRGKLVLFDRHYWDIVADPRRYRYGGFRSLAVKLGNLVPSPNVIFVLDADEEDLFKRKGEVTVRESAAQRQGYRELSAIIPLVRVVDASQPLDEVVSEILCVINGQIARSMLEVKGVGRRN